MAAAPAGLLRRQHDEARLRARLGHAARLVVGAVDPVELAQHEAIRQRLR